VGFCGIKWFPLSYIYGKEKILNPVSGKMFKKYHNKK
jgi:hypothetical protein